MSEAARMLESFLQRGVELWGEGSLLRFRATKGALTEPMRAQLSASKDALLSAWREVAAGAVEMHPATHGQRALWFLQKAIPDSAAYNIVFTARIRSRLDPAPLKNAFQALVDRHPSLRTTYEMREDRLFQRVHDFKPVWFETHQHAGMDLDTLRAEVIRASRAPFDLAGGPVLRVELFTRAQDDHVLLVTVHHIAVDGWSLFLLLDDLRGVYAAEQNGGPLPAARPAQHVTGFARWQEEMLSGPAGKAHEAYWLGQLSGELAPLNLPIDRPRPASLSARGATLELELGEDLSEAVRELAVREGVTPYVLLLAAYQVLLHRYSGQSEIIVGSPAYGRERAEFANIVGCLINMIPLRGEFHDDPPFREFLARMRRTALDGIEHQDYPFPLMVRKLQPHRDPSRTPVFQTLFILQKFRQLAGLEDFFSGTESNTRSELGGLVLEPFPIPQQEGQFDLSLELVEREGVFRGALKYNEDLFETPTVKRLAGHFKTLLRGAVDAPHTKVSRLSLLPPGEWHQLLVEWNATVVDEPRAGCLHHLIEAQVERTPDAVAIVFKRERLSYRELEIRSNQLANYLAGRGVGADSLVGICMERSVEMVVGLLGILKAGAAYVPMDPSYPRARLEFMLEDACVKVLLTQKHLTETLPAHGADTICLDGDWLSVARGSSQPPVGRAGTDNLAYMIYTSGSTGRPKGALNEHRGIVNRLLWMQQEYRLTDADAVLQKTPFSFDVSVWEFFWPLMAGARLVMARPGGHQDPEYLVDIINREGITVAHFVPSMLRIFLGAQGLDRCGSLRDVICSGEALSPDVVKAFYARLSANLHNLYGPTEAAVDVTYWPCPRREELVVVPIGRPVANTQCYILDVHGQPVPPGVGGELHIGGVQVGRGYHNRPELTEAKFVADPFSQEPTARLYRTGDLCRFRSNGEIEYLGRIDHQVKIRGFRIELGEIEAALGRHPAVKHAVVIDREVSPGDQRLVAYLVPHEGDALTPSGLREFLLTSLPDYMVPSAFVPLEKLPLSPNGKVDRKALPALESVDRQARAEYVPPRTTTEQIVAQVFEEVLSVGCVGSAHNFFELGGHSLLAARMVSQLRTHFHVELPLRALFEFPTVDGLSQYINTVLWTTRSASVDPNPSSEERVSIEI